jgi:hypothetical protein
MAPRPTCTSIRRWQTLVTRREGDAAIVVRDPRLARVDASAVAEASVATEVDPWRPPTAGIAYLWLIYCDRRGGIASQTLCVEVAPGE